MKMKLDNKQAVIEAATAGAKKYADEQLDLLRQFAGIDCGSRNEEGNRRVVEILDRLLETIDGIEIEHRYFEGYGINIIARCARKTRPARSS